MVRDFYDFVGQIDNLNRLSSPPLGIQQHSELLSFLGGHRELLKEELGRGDFRFASLAASMMIARAGLEPDPLELRQLEQALMRAGIEAVRDAEARLGGDFARVPVDPLVSVKPRDLGRVEEWGKARRGQAQSAPPGSQRNRGPPPDNAFAFSKLTDLFLMHQRRGRLWDAQTASQATKSFALFLEVCGDKPLRRYTRASAQQFKEVLQELSADYGKAADFRGRTLVDIAAIDARRGGQDCDYQAGRSKGTSQH